MIILLTCLLIVANPADLFAQDTIVDTLYSIPQLDGTIVYNSYYDTYVSDTLYPNNPVGDWWCAISGTVEYARTFFVFNLPSDIEGYSIINANVYIYQIGSYGNSIDGAYPIFNLTTGDMEPPCLIEHVDLGLIMDIDEFDTPALHPAEVLTSTSGQAWKFVNVLDWVIDDLANNRSYFQSRLRLSLNTDNDFYDDCIHFSMGSSWHHMPYIVYEYEPINAVENDQFIEKQNSIQITISPNPITSNGQIDVQSKNITKANISIYNIKGQLICKIFEGNINRGHKQISFDTIDLPSGIYFLKTDTDVSSSVKKMVVMK